MKMPRSRVWLAVGLLCGCAGGAKENGTAPRQPEQVSAAVPAGPAAAQGMVRPEPQAPNAQNTQQGAELDVASARIGNREALAFRVPFARDGMKMRLSPEAQRALASIALRAEQVQLRESFDGGSFADYAPELRDERLRLARSFLVDHGVAANRIEVVKPAGTPVPRSGSTPGAGGDVTVEILMLLPDPGAPR